MPGEIITIQAGQCGNQVGQQFWQQMCEEHKIQMDGEPNKENLTFNDCPGVFFRSSSTGRYTPRAILIDLEPRVIHSIRQQTNDRFFDPKDIYVASEGGGAANRWAEGYMNAVRNKEEIMDMINREIDSCDNFEGFQLVHSVAGGTGSGFGSLLLEELSDRFSKKLVQTYSVFGASEVVVEPYNTVLTLKRLIQNSDANIIVDNSSLTNIVSKNLRVLSPSYSDTNSLISKVMCGATSSIRFPLSMCSSLTSILSALIPTPELHFLIPSFTPLANVFRGNTAYDVLLEVLDRKLRMCGYNEPNEVSFSLLEVLFGSENALTMQSDSIEKAKDKVRERVNFAPWCTASQVVLSQTNDSLSTDEIVHCLMLANSTASLPVLRKVLTQFDQLMRRSAFLNNYVNSDYDTEIGSIMDEFTDSREVLLDQIDEYERSKSIDYMDLDMNEPSVGNNVANPEKAANAKNADDVQME
ncbi:hypothetical protein FOA43_001052 [Brettanomyces nanus]|uniref:Tubulin gamma chain n=1 Tax=Eeniella nana TaxID=13502 RepID=A0A875S1L6_EENNA|nr:uncharacterized protein FOA43_001052 [Brettanomyces nanus]QPG73739.1 hypothetical protein FOA43_001052 [Brettanomyces nanus]